MSRSSFDGKVRFEESKAYEEAKLKKKKKKKSPAVVEGNSVSVQFRCRLGAKLLILKQSR